VKGPGRRLKSGLAGGGAEWGADDAEDEGSDDEGDGEADADGRRPSVARRVTCILTLMSSMGVLG
jgi:hypothetical protein